MLLECLQHVQHTITYFTVLLIVLCCSYHRPKKNDHNYGLVQSLVFLHWMIFLQFSLQQCCEQDRHSQTLASYLGRCFQQFYYTFLNKLTLRERFSMFSDKVCHPIALVMFSFDSFALNNRCWETREASSCFILSSRSLNL